MSRLTITSNTVYIDRQPIGTIQAKAKPDGIKPFPSRYEFKSHNAIILDSAALEKLYYALNRRDLQIQPIPEQRKSPDHTDTKLKGIDY